MPDHVATQWLLELQSFITHNLTGLTASTRLLARSFGNLSAASTGNGLLPVLDCSTRLITARAGSSLNFSADRLSR